MIWMIDATKPSNMGPLVANTEDLISVLDRVLDKGIVIDPWVRISLHGIQLVTVDPRLAGANLALAAAAVYVGYEEPGSWVELDRAVNLFPYWRKDFWTK